MNNKNNSSLVELGIKLDKNLEYYDKLLKDNNFINDKNCITHDIYYTKINLDNLSEFEMKKACVRIRVVDDNMCKVQNTSCFKELDGIEFN